MLTIIFQSPIFFTRQLSLLRTRQELGVASYQAKSAFLWFRNPKKIRQATSLSFRTSSKTTSSMTLAGQTFRKAGPHTISPRSLSSRVQLTCFVATVRTNKFVDSLTRSSNTVPNRHSSQSETGISAGILSSGTRIWSSALRHSCCAMLSSFFYSNPRVGVGIVSTLEM